MQHYLCSAVYTAKKQEDDDFAVQEEHYGRKVLGKLRNVAVAKNGKKNEKPLKIVKKKAEILFRVQEGGR